MLNFECTDVFHENFKSTEKILINAGGTSSSKTYSICQLLLLKACSEPNSVITITGESIPNLKKGAYRDTENIVFNTKGLNEYIDSWNKSSLSCPFAILLQIFFNSLKLFSIQLFIKIVGD